MTCDSDLYLPGRVRRGEGEIRLEHETGTVPIRDPDGLLEATGAGEQLTLGFAVEYDEARATDGAIGVSTEDGTAVLVGSRTVQRARFDDRTPGPFHRIGFEPGVWPGPSSIVWGHGSNRPAPLGDCEERRPDRVRIVATDLRVREAFRGDRDPYAGPIEDLRFEFDPEGSAVRVTVPGVPAWATSGWHEKDPEAVLRLVGHSLRELLGGEESSCSHPTGFTPDLSLDGSAIRFDWRWTDHALGLWPPDGLAFDREAFVGAWLRDADLFDRRFGDGALSDLVADVRSLTDVEPAAGRTALRDPETVDRAELERRVRADPIGRRDAAVALWQRGDPAAVPALAETLFDEATRPGDRRALIGALDGIGDREAVAELIRYVRTAEPSRRRGLAAALLDERARSALANAVFDDGEDKGDLVAKRLRRRARDDPDTEIPDPAETRDAQLLLAAVLDPSAETLEEIDTDSIREVRLRRESVWATLDEADDPPGSRTVAAALLGEDEVTDARAARNGLLDVLRTDDSPRIRALAASTAASLGGVDLVDPLLDALVDEREESVRKRIALALHRIDHDAAERASADAVAERDGRPGRRRDLLDSSGYEGTSSAQSVREQLRSDDPAVWSVAAKSASERTADPPYRELIGLLNRVDPKRRSDWITEWQEGLDSLRALIKDERTGLPPVEPLLDLLDRPYRARGVALDALVELADAHESGDFHGVDPRRVHRAMFETQNGNPRPDLEAMADVAAATYDEFDPTSLGRISHPGARSAVLAKLEDRVGARAVPALVELADGSDEKLAARAQYELRSYPERVPVGDLDLDPASNDRVLFLYRRVAAASLNEGDRERAGAAIEAIEELTRDERWHVRAKGAEVLASLAVVDGVSERLKTVATSDPSAVVRAIALLGLANRPIGDAVDTLVAVATDASLPVIVRRAAWTVLARRAEDLDEAAFDRLDAPPAEYDPALRRLVHRVLVEGGSRDPEATPDADRGRPELDVPPADDPEARTAALAEIAREADDPSRRAAAAETLRETYVRSDAIDAADVADPLGDVLADGDAADEVRATAATSLVRIRHGAAFRALDDAAPADVGLLD